MNITVLLPLLQLILTSANILVIGYGFFKFLNKPHDTLEERVTAHDVEIADIKKSLLQGNDRFREQNDTNEVLIRSVFALLEFEVHYCETEQKPITRNLERAKDELHDFLSKK